MQKNKKLVTHDGSFHADDIFACATLMLLLEKKGEHYEIIRTRDEKIIETGDYVFDVGGVYDEAKNRFDHHQVGGAGKRDNIIEYSSFGLVWKKFGAEISGSKEAVNLIDKKLVSPIDAGDNGLDLVENKYEVAPYFLQQAFFAMYPTWKEKNLKLDEMFLKSVEIAKIILSREIIQARDIILARLEVERIYKDSADKRIIIFDTSYPFEEILNNFPEPLFAVYPRSDGTWGVKGIKDDPNKFESRKKFPKAWAGLMNEELQKASGVSDAIFCHRSLKFIAVAKSKEGAIKLAQIAVESK